ncbi:DUF4037 domain-containing protein [Luteimicrobium sp. NPDC057192]|uniref:DUF4037 domain-containing protein n=1 Tax=Luteimicrobium sp. NPDC057192 TaxID=3346042 RepID=UPI003635D9EE
MTTQPPLSGAALAQTFYDDAVAPVLAAAGVTHAAGRLGSGSDVLGFDDGTSRDHDWGLRLTVLVSPDDVADVDALLDARLPESWQGHPVRFATTWDPEVRHRVEVASVRALALARLGIDPTDGLEPRQWLALTGQSVLEVCAGPVLHDGPGELTALRARLAGYPDDVRRYVVAAGWAHLGQELPFVGRTGSRGDELGSAVLTGRLARVAMHLGHVLEGRWAPYAKWLGTSFATLPSASAAGPHLRDALAATAWPAREAALARAFDVLLGVQAAVGLPVPAPTPDGGATIPFFDRPFRGVAPVPEVVRASITDPSVLALPAGVGCVEQWVDDVHVLMDPARRLSVTQAVLRDRADDVRPGAI